MNYIDILMAVLGGYFLGAIPFGLVLAKMAGKGDIRNIGSGNIGATNVLRTGRKDLAIATLILDAGKAGIAALIFGKLFGYAPGLAAGGAALIGHCYPVWLKFKGGKGVATYFGTLLAVNWPLALAAAMIWVVSAATFRMVSLAGIITAVLIPIAAYILTLNTVYFAPLMVLCVVMGSVIILRHRENVGRIMTGSEPKIGKKT